MAFNFNYDDPNNPFNAFGNALTPPQQPQALPFSQQPVMSAWQRFQNQPFDPMADPGQFSPAGFIPNPTQLTDADKLYGKVGASTLSGVASGVDQLLNQFRGLVALGQKSFEGLRDMSGPSMIKRLQYDQWTKDPSSVSPELQQEFLLQSEPSISRSDKGAAKLVNDIVRPVQEKAHSLSRELRKAGFDDSFIGKVLEGVGNAAVTIPSLMATQGLAGPFNFALHGALTGAGESEGDLGETITGGARGLVIDKAFRALHKVFGKIDAPLSAGDRLGIGAGMGAGGIIEAGMTTGELPEAEDVAASFLTGVLLPVGRTGKPAGKNMMVDAQGNHLFRSGPGVGTKEIKGKEVAYDYIKQEVISDPKEKTQAATESIPEFKEASWLYRMAFASGGSIEGLSRWAKKNGIEIDSVNDPALVAAASRGWLGQAKSVLHDGPFRINEKGIPEKTAPSMQDYLLVAEKALNFKGHSGTKIEGKPQVSAGGGAMAAETGGRIEPTRSKVSAANVRQIFGDFSKAVRILTDLQNGVRVRQKSPTTGRMEEVEIRKATDKETIWANEVVVELKKLPLEKQNGLVQALKMKNEFQHGLLDMMAEGSLISRQEAIAIKAENPNHIPFERMFPEDTTSLWAEITGDTTKTGRKGRKPRKISGKSDRETHDVLESSSRRVYETVKAVNDNKSKLSIVAMGEHLPPGTIEMVNRKVKPIDVKSAELESAVRKEGGVYSESLPDIRIWRPEELNVQPKEGEISLIRDGVQEIWKVPKSISRLYTSNDSGIGWTFGKLMKSVLTVPTSILRRSITLNPVFAAKNFIRDQWTASMQTDFGFRPFFDPISTIFDILGRGELYQEYLRSGGSIERGYGYTSKKNLETSVRELMNDKSMLGRLNPIASLEALTNMT